ncbi:MAG TPA: glycoside hydrolase family 2 TIM barrel-domain containing protein [Chitinophagaceae bacterium]|jgi:beta-glucuronidase|nr:glycoside hydrolase family 2 TIM barrel-domain containing protein [Chitinophagaceae bacterium]
MMKNTMNRLVIAAVLLSAGSKMYAQSPVRDYKSERQLLTLDAKPTGTISNARFTIDGMLVAELTDDYAVKTNTTKYTSWKTVIDPQWLDKGEHTLRIEGTSSNGAPQIKTIKIQGTKQNTANRISLCGEWAFAEESELPAGSLDGETPKAVRAGFREGKWTNVLVPNSLGALNAKWNKYEGILGIYKKDLMIESKPNEQIFLLLESVYWSGRVFVNGQFIGETHGGYLPTRFNIGRSIKQGLNEITVIVDNRFSTMGGLKRINEFYWNWGGLIQEVYLEKYAPVVLTDLRAEGNMKGGLQLHVAGLNANTTAQKKNITTEVYNAAGKKVLGPVAMTVDIPGGSTVLSLKPLTVANPTLWDMDNPYLYTVIVKGDFGTLQTRTGFRDVKVQGKDITLNGKVIQGLQGFNRHADYPGLGRTQPAALAYNELKMLRDKGFRFFRPAHYPTTPAQLDAADELGLLVIEEVNVTGLKGAVMGSKEVIEFGMQQLTKMIHRDRGHPSLIAYSVGNENLTEEEGAADYVRTVIARGKSMDPNRLYTQVTHRHTNDQTFQYQDFVAQNYYAGWYAKDINSIVNLLESIQSYADNKPIMLSEYGAEATIRKEGTGKSTEFWQGMVVDAHNRLLNDRKHFFGKMYWCSTEFWCRPNWTGGSPDPVPPFHVKSLISLDREYKKLGWRVMFSPVRIILNSHTVKANELGGDIITPADKDTTISQVITVKEIRGKTVKGVLSMKVPDGFTATEKEFPFTLQPGEGKSFRVAIAGKLVSPQKSAEWYIRAVIDEDTEAQPMLIGLKLKELINP